MECSYIKYGSVNNETYNPGSIRTKRIGTVREFKPNGIHGQLKTTVKSRKDKIFAGGYTNASNRPTQYFKKPKARKIPISVLSQIPRSGSIPRVVGSEQEEDPVSFMDLQKINLKSLREPMYENQSISSIKPSSGAIGNGDAAGENENLIPESMNLTSGFDRREIPPALPSASQIEASGVPEALRTEIVEAYNILGNTFSAMSNQISIIINNHVGDRVSRAEDFPLLPEDFYRNGTLRPETKRYILNIGYLRTLAARSGVSLAEMTSTLTRAAGSTSRALQPVVGGAAQLVGSGVIQAGSSALQLSGMGAQALTRAAGSTARALQPVVGEAAQMIGSGALQTGSALLRSVPTVASLSIDAASTLSPILFQGASAISRSIEETILLFGTSLASLLVILQNQDAARALEPPQIRQSRTRRSADQILIDEHMAAGTLPDVNRRETRSQRRIRLRVEQEDNTQPEVNRRETRSQKKMRLRAVQEDK